MVRFLLLLLLTMVGAASGMVPASGLPSSIMAAKDGPSSRLFEAINCPAVMEDFLTGPFFGLFDKATIMPLIVRMAERERIYSDDAMAFYHGTTHRYLLYLTLSKLLYQRFGAGGDCFGFEFLRTPGTRTDLQSMELQHYLADISASGCKPLDHDPVVRQHLLSTSYTPLAAHSAESALFFFLFDLNIAGYRDEAAHINELFAAYGLQVPPGVLAHFGEYAWSGKAGLMLQLFIRRDVLEQLVYDAHPCGEPTNGPLVDLSVLPLSYATSTIAESTRPSPFMLRTLIESKASMLKTWPLKTMRSLKFWSAFNGQARVLLRPEFFDCPNEYVKIFVYDLASSDEHAGVQRAAESIIAYAQPLDS